MSSSGGPERFRRIIREQFLEMYERHDVLQDVFDKASADLGATANKRLSKVSPPRPGKLDINDVLEAEYAFA